MRNRRGLLQLEGLTERIVPAVSIRAVDGDLLITGIANTNAGFQKLWVNVTGNNQVNIQDGGSAFGTGGVNRGVYAVTGDLIFSLSNRSDQLTIDFNGAFTLDGSISANLFNGNDTVTITHSTGAAAGFDGNLTIDGGNGTDALNINNTKAGSTFEIGGLVSFNGGAGGDTANINDSSSSSMSIGAGLSLTRVNIVEVGSANDVDISGNVTINASADKLITNNFTIGGGTVNIAGALAITGGQGADTVALDTVNVVDVVPAEDEVLEISINLDRSGTIAKSTHNTLTMTDVQLGTNGTDADFAYTGGTGDDSLEFVGTNDISGDAVFVFGNGVNALVVSSGTTFYADVTVTGGKSDDTITLNNSVISGLLTATMGNGTNELTSAGTFEGGLTYTGGSNVDTVELTNAENLAGDVSISVGAGADIVEITGITTGVSVTSLTIDLGVDSVTDNLDYDTDFDSLITILNQGSSDSINS